MSACRYTYGQPVRGRALISVSVQPYSRWDSRRYGLKQISVEVSEIVTFSTR